MGLISIKYFGYGLKDMCMYNKSMLHVSCELFDTNFRQEKKKNIAFRLL